MDFQKAGLLHEQFVIQASKTPFNIAVVDVNHCPMSYEKLDKLTDQLACVMQSRGVIPGSIVVIHMDKCVQYVVTYISILKAGASYLPLDVSYPQSLVSDIMIEAEPKLIVTKTALMSITSKYIINGVSHIILDDETFIDNVEHLSEGLEYVQPSLSFESTAFVVYSSGTTGKPKGISVPMRAPVLSYKWRHDYYPYDANEREAANVFFVWELLRPLLRGQTLYIIPDDTIYDPPKLLEFLNSNAITRMLFTPSLLETVLEFSIESLTDGFKSMKQVWLCGEVTTTALIEKSMRILPHVQFINLYSVSECHDVAAINLTAFYKDKPEKLLVSKFAPVGQLLPGVKVVILNKEGQVQPVGVAGEMYVYGPTLANGYLKRPDITSEKFINLPESISGYHGCGDQRMYKTGDWGYLLSDRSLEICGRCDAMVKIRGYSVEVSAIETVVMGLSCIQSCVVITMGEEGQDKCLVAYVVPNKATTVRRIRGELKRRLPFYMIPSYFIFLKEIPILAGSGKLNRKALPPLIKDDPLNKPEFSPKTETEKTLAEIWSDVLQQSSIDVQESFFDMGGHSLLAAKLLQIVNNRFGSKLSVKELYTSPTITSMAKIIDGKCPKSEPVTNLSQEVTNHCQYDNDLDIQLRAFWRFSSFNKTRWSSASVLLTGATGYLGAFLLAELLRSTESHIFCLIRDNNGNMNSKNVVAIERRVHDTMKQYQLICDSDLTQLMKQRVTYVKGDVSLINFGLSEDDYRYLSTEIDYVIHAAAYVNLVYPYSALYSSNVLGTCNVIKFASNAKIKPLHYISTDAVFPLHFVGKECSDISDLWSTLKDGYGQSKWVAEQIVSKSSERGHPVVIYRLGNQAPDSVNGALNSDDFNFMMIRSFACLGGYPDLDWSIEMTPVNFTARVIVQFSKILSNHVGKIYHLFNNNRLAFSSLQKRMRIHGYKTELMTYEQYMQRLKNSGVSFQSKLYSMLSEVADSGEYFTNLTHHDSQYSLKLLEEMGFHYPKINDSLITLYLTKFIERGLISIPKDDDNNYKLFDDINNIRGKVAVVTGASSGIGEETSIYLARAGCVVALLARRLDKLKTIQDIIKSFGGKAMIVKADVTKESEVDTAVQSITKTLGAIDILINCAGAMYYQRVHNPKMSDAIAMIDVNVKGLFLCTTTVLPSMVERKSGHIVNISSDAGLVGFPGLAVYSGTKFFVEGYSQALRKEVSKYNIRVSCIQPGDVATPLQQASMTSDKTAKEFFPTHTEAILEAKDVARTIVFVLSCPKYMAVNQVLVEPTSAPI